MRKYVLSYDVLSKEKLEREGEKIDCKNFSKDEDFRVTLIELLCKIESITKIDWKNNTTITFDSTEAIIDKVQNDIIALGYCIDFYIALIHFNDSKDVKSNGFVYRQKIRQTKSVKNFKKLIDENCERLKR